MRDDPVMHPRWRLAIAIGVALMAVLQPGTAANLVAQQPTPVVATADQVRDWLRSAEQLLLEQRGAQAIVLFERARDVAEQLGLHAPQAQALCGIGEARYWQAQYAPAREAASRALAIFERLASSAADADRRPLDHGIGRAAHVLSMVGEQEGKHPQSVLHQVENPDRAFGRPRQILKCERPMKLTLLVPDLVSKIKIPWSET
jgi:hypothetical protein